MQLYRSRHDLTAQVFAQDVRSIYQITAAPWLIPLLADSLDVFI